MVERGFGVKPIQPGNRPDFRRVRQGFWSRVPPFDKLVNVNAIPPAERIRYIVAHESHLIRLLLTARETVRYCRERKGVVPWPRIVLRGKP
jgi:hypothetical protein